MTRPVRLIFPALALLALALSGCAGEDEPGELPPPAGPVQVRVSQAVAMASSESVPATLVAEREADLATRMSGTVEAVSVDVGDRVTAGQPVVRVDAGDIRARIDAAAAQMELAERTHRRVQNLAADRAASQQELDEAAARLEAARGALADARAQAEYALVRAPFAGVVTQRLADPGALAVPGRPLLRIVGGGDLKVEADLPSARAGELGPGDPVRIVVPGGGTHTARVTRVVPAVEPGSRRFRVEATLEGTSPAGLLPGTYVRLELPTAGGATWWIPEDAVVRRGQLTGAYLVEGGQLRLRWLRLGERRRDAVEVLAAPALDDLTVVRRPGPELADGVPVDRVTVEPWSAPHTPGVAGSEPAAGEGSS